MAKPNRVLSGTSVYHLIIRGVNRQNIFFDNEDRNKFLWVLRDCVKKRQIDIYAYCIMDNHVHLLANTEDHPPCEMMSYIETVYAGWYNKKYERTGHLFQSRFKSEPVESADYFLCAIRYIHFNPVKAKMIVKPEDYNWSSARTYNGFNDLIVDKEPAIAIAGNKEYLLKFISAEADDCFEDAYVERKTDEEATEMLLRESKCVNVYEFINLQKNIRDEIIRKLRKRGVMVSQLSRITGLSKSLIVRASTKK